MLMRVGVYTIKYYAASGTVTKPANKTVTRRMTIKNERICMRA
jgi:hypothetical protein